MKEADGKGLDAFVLETRELAGSGFQVDGLEYGAVEAKALGHLAAEVSGRERLGLPGAEVVEGGALLARDLEEVAESFCGDEARARPGAFDEGVGARGGAVGEEGDPVERQEVGEGAEPGAGSSCAGHALREVRWSGGDFAEVRLASVEVERDDICEGASDVDADMNHRTFLRHGGSLRHRSFLPGHQATFPQQGPVPQEGPVPAGAMSPLRS